MRNALSNSSDVPAYMEKDITREQSYKTYFNFRIKQRCVSRWGGVLGSAFVIFNGVLQIKGFVKMSFWHTDGNWVN
jgi:hypothetical protein